MELANVTPIFKKEDKQLIKNHRPISLLPICDKILENIIFNNLYNRLITHHLVSKKQSGFRRGDSTSKQLIDHVNDIHHAFDSTKPIEVRAIILDISKAFDKRPFQKYLNHRKQCVVLDGFPASVPLGSVLGPLLFLIYINNLERNIKFNVYFFLMIPCYSL